MIAVCLFNTNTINSFSFVNIQNWKLFCNKFAKQFPLFLSHNEQTKKAQYNQNYLSIRYIRVGTCRYISKFSSAFRPSIAFQLSYRIPIPSINPSNHLPITISIKQFPQEQENHQSSFAHKQQQNFGFFAKTTPSSTFNVCGALFSTTSSTHWWFLQAYVQIRSFNVRFTSNVVEEKSLFFYFVVLFFFFCYFSAVLLILVEVPCSQSDRSIASLVFKKK